MTEKRKMNTDTLLAPVPAALVSCGSHSGAKNIITLAWVGVVNSSPPMVSIAVRPSRHSYALIKETEEFVVNLPTVDQVELVDRCGVISGRQVDKFARFKLTPLAGELHYAPLIKECPVNLECRLKHSLELGSHALFIGEIISVFCDAQYVDGNGRFVPGACNFLGFGGGFQHYLSATGLNRKIGFSGRD